MTAFLALPVMGVAQQGWALVRVMDKVDSSAVSQATVILDGDKGGYTDTHGEILFTTSTGLHEIEVRYGGFDDLTQEIVVLANDTLTVEIYGGDEGSELDVVVISSSQFEKKLVEEIVSVEVLDKDLIRNNNSIELGEALNRSVGVQTQGEQITIRGGSAWSYGVGSRTAILVDGLPFTSADLGSGELKFAPLEFLDQVEVVKGAASVVYGSSALNGVVNMRTIWPGEKPKTEIQTYMGFYGDPPRPEMRWYTDELTPGFNGGFFNHSQRNGNLDIVVGGNYHYLNSYLEEGHENRGRMGFKTRYHVPGVKGMHFGLNGNFMAEHSGRFYLASHLIDSAYNVADGSYDRYTRVNIDPHFTFLTNRGDKHRFNARYLNVYRRGNGDDPDAVSDFFNFDYQYQRRIGERIFLTAGLPFSIGIGKSNIYPGKRKAWSGAAYVQGEYKYDRLTLTGGVRYEASAVDVVFSTALPVFRFGANYKMGRGTYLRGSFGQAYRLPTIGERFVSTEFTILNIVPNPDLLPERGWGSEFGIRQALKIQKWLGYADFSVFMNDYKNFVEYTLGFWGPDGEPTGNFTDLGLQPLNIDNARVAGFEVSGFGRGKFGPVELQTLLGYTYIYPGNLNNDTTQRDYGVFISNALEGITNRYEDVKDDRGVVIDERSARLMNFRNRHLFKADVQLSWQGFSVGYNAFYASFPERWEFLFQIAVPGTVQYIDNHGNGDWVHSIRAGWQFSKVGRANIIVKNLMNHEYMVRPGMIEAPRSYTLQLNFKLEGKLARRSGQ